MLVDPFGRSITYLRVSVTDRCDLRCLYCMDETTTFLPKPDVLTLEEMDRLCRAFVRLGVRRIRITGGEPLARRGVGTLIASLGRLRDDGALDELTLTTNGSRLADCAGDLYAAGVRRINVSLDTLDADTYARITRWGRIERALEGIEAAKAAGLSIKINAVVMRGLNAHAIDDLIVWCGLNGFDLALIEVMPLGRAGGDEDRYVPLDAVRADLAQRWTLADTAHRTPGPARYVAVAEAGIRLGFITPLTHNFCEGCNRVRLTCTGRLVLCLGREDAADLRAVLRSGADDAALEDAVRVAISAKPQGHDFVANRAGWSVPPTRLMSQTGG